MFTLIKFNTAKYESTKVDSYINLHFVRYQTLFNVSSC